MLLLSRKKGQRILIGDNIVIEVKSISGNQVSIGIDAPDGISVDREEIRYRDDYVSRSEFKARTNK